MNNNSIRLADKLNLFFIIFFTGIIILYFNKIENNKIIFFQYILLLITQIYLLKKKSDKIILKIVKDFIFPTICILIIFNSLTYIIPAINPMDIDHQLIRADYLIFNTYPTIIFEKLSNAWLTDLMQICYTTYYFLPLLIGITLKIHKKENEFQKGLFLILFCFYISYIGYILFPALGPRYTIPHLHQEELKGYIFYSKINAILNSLEGIKRDAFPSGHTAITLVVLHIAYKYEKKLFYFILPISLMLVLSTIYCRYHYGVDVIGGILLYIIIIKISKFIITI